MTLPMNINDPSVSLAVTDSSARVAYGRTVANRIIIYNQGDNDAFVKSGNSAVEAATTDACIPSKAVMTYSKRNTDTHIAGICASGETTALKVQAGEGD